MPQRIRATTRALLIQACDLPKLYSHYAPFKTESANRYACFYAEGEGFNMAVYAKEHEGAHKVVFQGERAEAEASKWDSYSLAPRLFIVPDQPKTLRKEEPIYVNRYPQIGSDEVGTGDLFGPIVVVAAHITENDLPRLNELGVTDSKKLADSRILALGPILSKEFAYSALILDNEKYNSIVESGENMVSIKAKMHNRCLLNLKKRFPSSFLYQDQFVTANVYYKYLTKEKEVADGITFKTKGETAFPSVALASVLARYAFLEKMEKMSQRYSFSFPFGSSNVEEALKEFIELHGKEELKKVAKTNFATIDKLGL